MSSLHLSSKSTTRFWIITLLALTLSVGVALNRSQPTRAQSNYVALIPNGSKNSCATCHDGVFKTAFANANHTWTMALALADSDGDGFTNGDELQDPTGAWVTGNSDPGNVAFVSVPNLALNYPPAPSLNDVVGITNNMTVTGVINLSASLSTTVGVRQVVYEVLSNATPVVVFTTTTAPFTFVWDTREMSNGTYSLRATAEDKRAAGQGGPRQSQRTETGLKVFNQTIPGAIRVAFPTNAHPYKLIARPNTGEMYVLRKEGTTSHALSRFAPDGTLDPTTFRCLAGCNPSPAGVFGFAYDPVFDAAIVSSAQGSFALTAFGLASWPPSGAAYNGDLSAEFVIPQGTGVLSSSTQYRTFFVDYLNARLVETEFGTVRRYFYTDPSPLNMAVDNRRNRVFVTNLGNNFDGHTVTVFDFQANVTSTVNVGGYPFDVVVNEQTNRIYVTNQFSNSVSVIDGATLSATQTILNVTSPSYVAVDPARQRLYVTSRAQGTLTVIDTQTNQVLKTHGGLNQPEGVAVNPTNGWVYVANYTDDSVAIYPRYDLYLPLLQR